MNMDDSTGGGRLVFYIDEQAASALRTAAERTSVSGNARAASDLSGLSLEVSLTGAVETSRTVPVQENAVVTFDSLPVGGTVRVKAKAFKQIENYGAVSFYEGTSEPIVIQEGNNAVSLPLAKIKQGLSVPLSLEAITAGTITITNPWTTLKYTINGGALTAFPNAGSTSGSVTAAAGDVICLYAEASENTSTSNTMQIGCSADCYVYGNVMSLVSLDGDDWKPNATELTTPYAFASLFKNNAFIRNHASKALYLPATTLAEYCYYGVFNGCTSLTTAPELPATTLAQYCYNGMFNGCTGLTASPELPAITLAEHCYSEMFNGCTGLTAAPALPATTLAQYCYYTMFYGCTSLTASPVLRATTLVANCYKDMFKNCSSLNSITCLATVPSTPSDALSGWVDGVASSGTFYKAASADWSSVDNGIPSGWAQENYTGN